MADIQVRIKLNAGVSGDEIQSVDFNQETNNVSKAVGSKTTKNDGQNLISWGEEGLIPIVDGYVGGANSTLSSQGGYNGFVFGVVPENKMYSVEVTLEGSNIDSVTFYGDRNANQFPTRAIVNGEYIYSDDAEWAIVFPSSSATQTITFDMWNRANYNACFTHIGVFANELVFDKGWIKSIESLSQSTGQPKDIYYGLIPSRGIVEILDRNGEIKDYIQEGILEVKDVPINVYCKDNDILHHISEDGGYSLENKSLSLTLTDKFVGLLDNQYNGKNLSSSTNAYILISDLLNSMGYGNYIDIILGEEVVVSDFEGSTSHKNLIVKEYLSKITIPYPYLEKSTYREALNKFCVLAQLNLMKKDGADIPIFVSARPIVLNKNNKIINVPKRMQFSELTKDIIVRNKINNIVCEYQKVDYDFRELGTRNIQIFDSPTSSYPIIYSTYYDKYKILGKDILIGEDSTSYNKDIEIIKNGITDVWSVSDIKLPIYRYSIVKFTINEKPNIDLQEMQFRVSASVNFIRFNKIEETTNDVTRGKFEWVDYTSSLDLDVKDSSFSDDAVISGWINPNNNSYIGENLDMKVRVNVDSIDIFVAMLESITSTTSNKVLHSIYDSYSLNISIKDINVENVKPEYVTDMTISSNELIQQNTLFNETPIRTLIENNILFDYKNGIKTGKITVCCSDYYYLDGNIAKNWSTGEILEVGDIVKNEGDETIWRITGRNFRKVGVPMIDLELQEVRVVG